MTGNVASTSVIALARCLACLAALTFPWNAQARPSGDGGQEAETFLFQMDPQPLGEAMDAYSRATGLDVLMDSEHAQRLSSAIKGRYTAAEAREIILSGTGLESRSVNAASIVVHASAASATMATALPPALPMATIPGVGSNSGLQQYAGRMQDALRRALCASSQTRPGSYRLALQLRLDSTGKVERLRLLDTTGDPRRDAAIERRLQGAQMGAPPPEHLSQPVAMLLLPDGPDTRTDCSSPVPAGG